MNRFVKMFEKVFGPKQEYKVMTIEDVKRSLMGDIARPITSYDVMEGHATVNDFRRAQGLPETREVWYCKKHKFKLDSVHMSVDGPDQDLLMFSCSNTRSPDGQKCWGSDCIDRGEFWLGIKKSPEEQEVDPEWLANYQAHIYNQNLRAFERAIHAPLLYLPTEGIEYP